MRIDIHTHIWIDQGTRVDEFVAKLDKHGVDKAVVHPIAPYVPNEFVAECVAKHPDRLIGFASVAPFAETTGIPREDPLVMLDRAVNELGLRGLKLHPTMQGFTLNDPGLVPLMHKAAELGIPVLFHTGPTRGRAGRIKQALVEHLDDLAIMCPDTVIIAGHGEILMHGHWVAAKHPNVYLDTAITWSEYCPVFPGLGEMAIRTAGAHKILFGTDFNPDREDRLDATLAVIDSLNISAEEKELILGGNAAKILNIDVG